MSETKLRELLHDLADAVPGPEPEIPRTVAVGTRRRIALRVGSMVVAAALIAALAISASRGFLASDRRPVKQPPTPTPTTSASPRLVGTGSDLYLVDPDTGELTKVLAAEGDQRNPERSPDGTQIVYQSRVGGTDDEPVFQIFVLEADGTQRQLTDVRGGAEDPSWSPDGRRIAFSGSGPATEVYVVNADGSNLVHLVHQKRTGPFGFWGAHPDWSPDGTHIAFTGGYPGGIWVVSVGDGTLTQLTRNDDTDGDHDPEWSPDGRWIVFIHSEVRPGTKGSNLEFDVDTDLWLVRPDGTDSHALLRKEGERFRQFPSLSPDGHFQGPPTWSPDGRVVAFWGGVHCECVLFVEVGTGRIRSLDGGPEGMSWGPTGILASSE